MVDTSDTARLYLYSQKHREQYVVGIGVPSAQFRAWCLQQEKLLGRGEDVKTVLATEELTHAFKKDYWFVTEACEYQEEDRKWKCQHISDGEGTLGG